MDLQVRSSLFRNGGIMMTTQLITWVSTFILLLFLPRMLGSEDFGALYLAISLAMILEISIDFGGSLLIPKEVARDRNRTAHILTSYLAIRVLVWVAGIMVIMLFSWLVGYTEQVMLLIFIIGVSKLWEGASRTIRSCFQGIERMEYPSVGIIGEKVFVSAVAVTLLFLGYGVVTIALVIMAGTLLNLLISILFIPKLTSSLPRVEWRKTLGVLSSSLPYFLGAVFAVIYFRIDAVMLSLFTSDEVVGWYGAAYRFFDIVMFIPSILTVVIFPILSRLWISEKDKLATTSSQTLSLVTLVGVPVTLLIFFNASHIVDLFFGLEEYYASIIILQLFAVGILIIYIDFIFGSTIMAVDKQRQWAFIAFIAIFINIGLNYFFIPYTQLTYGNGGIGAAIATLITELYIMVAAIVMIPRDILREINLRLLAKLGIAGVLMGGVLKLGTDLDTHWIVTSLVAVAVYAIALLLTKVVRPNHMRMLIELIPSGKFKTIFLTQKS